MAKNMNDGYHTQNFWQHSGYTLNPLSALLASVSVLMDV